MSITVPYIKKRGDIYYYVRRIPEAVKKISNYQSKMGAKNFYQRSLGTKDRDEAIAQSVEIDTDFEKRVASVKPLLLPKKYINRTKLTQGHLDEIEAERMESVIGPLRTSLLLADQDPLEQQYIEYKISRLEDEASELKKAITETGYVPPINGSFSNYPNPIEQSKMVIRDMNLDVSVPSTDFGLVISAVRRGLLKGYDFVFSFVAGDITNKNLLEIPQMVAIEPFTLDDAVAVHLNFREFPERTQTELRKAVAEFEKYIGRINLADITKNNVEDFVEQIGKKIIGGKSKGSIERRISPMTVQKKVRLLGAAVGRSIKKVPSGKNPFRGIKVTDFVPNQDPKIMRKKRPFEISELNEIMEYPWFSGCKSSGKRNQSGKLLLDDAYFWAPVVALFTGCRAAELGGMLTKDVRYGANQPHPHFVVEPNKYRTIKNNESRFVPINKHLWELGFEKYLDARKSKNDERLFPDWKPSRKTPANDTPYDRGWSNGNIIKAFNRSLLTKVLPAESGTRSAVTFHSLRGAFKSTLGLYANAIPPNVINEVIGHSKAYMDNRYVGTVPLQETYPLVSNFSFPDFKLPPKR